MSATRFQKEFVNGDDKPNSLVYGNTYMINSRVSRLIKLAKNETGQDNFDTNGSISIEVIKTVDEPLLSHWYLDLSRDGISRDDFKNSA